MKPLWPDEVEQRIRREARNLDPQKGPDEVVMCKRCVVTNQRPRIVFDEEGVCSACRYAERKKQIDWAERKFELQRLLVQNTKTGAPYNVVVPASGGKDSSFVATTLRDMGERVLCARWAPFMTTEIGEKNWQNFVHSSFDTVTAQPNGLMHRKLARLALEFYGDPFQPFVYGQLCWPMHVAAQNGVGLVFFGENGEAEYGGDPSANDKPCWDTKDWARVYAKGASVKYLVRLGMELGAFNQEDAYALSPFYNLPPDFASYHSKGNLLQIKDPPEFHWLGYYLPWHPQGNYYHACEQTGFEANPERSHGTYSRYASLDDKLDFLHYRGSFVKFGIGRATSDAAHEIRDGDLTRDEGLALVAKYDDEHPNTSPYFEECLTYLGIDAEWYEQIEKRFSKHLNQTNDQRREVFRQDRKRSEDRMLDMAGGAN